MKIMSFGFFLAFLVGYNDASIIEWGISSGNDIEARALLIISYAVASFCVARGISNEKPGHHGDL